ncbi:MAG: aspartate:alanine exchanger family transporter [Polyangiaceae bacterium]
MIALLTQSPFLLLMVVSGIGFLLGKIEVGGFSLGVSAVLFVGLGIGALAGPLKLPEIVFQLGLILFVYTVGLSSGPGFFSALRARGLRDNLLVLGMVVFGTVLVVMLARAFGIRGTHAAGLFAGSLTNTPALAAVIDFSREHAPAGLADRVSSEPVIAYSVAYPMGVLGVLVAIYAVQRLFRTDYAAEAVQAKRLGLVPDEIVDATLRVTRTEMEGRTLGDLQADHGWPVVFSRHKHGDEIELATRDTRLAEGDLLSAIGAREAVAKVTETLGEPSPEPLFQDRSVIDFRRVFVSSHAVLGKKIRELSLPQRFGAILTRVRRGDVDLLARADLVLEPGDRVRVVAPAERIRDVSAFFGDSMKALSEIDVGVFGLGVALGLLLGMLPLPLPGGLSFKLGLAGGPLIAGLVLGALGRSGPVVWHMPYNANLTLRQFGLILFLAGVGTRSGRAFVQTLGDGGGLVLFGVGVLCTIAVASLALVVGHKVLKIPMALLIGVVSGLHTQPAVLAFASEQAKSELPNVGYSTVYPMATVAKIVAAQLIVAFLS